MIVNHKINTTILIIILTIFISCNTNAQTVSILLKESGIHKEQLSTKRQSDTNVVINIPSKLFQSWSLRSVAFNPLQSMYDEVMDGKRSLLGFKKFVNANKIDTTFLSEKKMSRNLIYIFTGIDNKGIKHVMIDANNNRDFADDKMFSFNLHNKEKNYPETKVVISYFDGEMIKDAWVTMVIDAYSTGAPDSYFSIIKDKNLDIIMYNVFPNLAGEFSGNKQQYMIKIDGYNKFYKNAAFNLAVEKTVVESKAYNSYSYSSKDTIDIGYSRYKVSSFNYPVLILDFVGKKNTGGAEINTIAPVIEGNDLVTNEPFSLKKQLGKYVLIDFWGSWCGPCIKAIPELINIYQQYKDEIEFVSVAFDKAEDRGKLNVLINKYEMTWHHLFDDMDVGKGIITKQYKVQEYPTSVLIDPKGKVVFRSVGEAGLRNLAFYLKKLGMNGVK